MVPVSSARPRWRHWLIATAMLAILSQVIPLFAAFL
jgi:hypothetical protein